MNIVSTLWILMAWGFSARVSIATVLNMHPCISRCLRFKWHCHQNDPTMSCPQQWLVHWVKMSLCPKSLLDDGCVQNREQCGKCLQINPHWQHFQITATWYFNHLSKLATKEWSAFLAFYNDNPPLTGGFPAQRASYKESVSKRHPQPK